MAERPTFRVRPPLRCCQAELYRDPPVCGKVALWFRPGPIETPAAYFCGQHKRPGDEPIPDHGLFHRVSVTVEVSFSGASAVRGIAHQEAIARLELAVRRAGGVMNLHTVTSATGRYEPTAAPGRASANGDRGY